jgi:transcription elongation factor Elf1
MAYGTATVQCPNCGKTGSYPIRNTDGGQAESCKHCDRNFYIEVRNKQVVGVRKA